VELLGFDSLPGEEIDFPTKAAGAAVSMVRTWTQVKSDLDPKRFTHPHGPGVFGKDDRLGGLLRRAASA
jgi:DNA primase